MERLNRYFQITRTATGIGGKWYAIVHLHTHGPFDTEAEAEAALPVYRNHPPRTIALVPPPVPKEEAPKPIEPPVVESVAAVPPQQEALTLLWEASDIFERNRINIEGYEWIKRVRSYLKDRKEGGC
jgi:hypothetical protein